MKNVFIFFLKSDDELRIFFVSGARQNTEEVNDIWQIDMESINFYVSLALIFSTKLSLINANFYWPIYWE